jgi:hypothetical protein
MQKLFEAARLLATCEHLSTAVFELRDVCLSCGAWRFECTGPWRRPEFVQRTIDGLAAVSPAGTNQLVEDILLVAWEVLVDGNDEEGLRRALRELRWMAAFPAMSRPQG